MDLLNRLPLLLLLILSAAGVVLGDYFAKTWSLNQKGIFYLLAFAGYMAASFFYIPTLLKESLVITSIIWSLLSIIGFMFIGLVVFKETLTTTQTVGVVFGVAALLILSFSAHEA